MRIYGRKISSYSLVCVLYYARFDSLQSFSSKSFSNSANKDGNDFLQNFLIGYVLELRFIRWHVSLMAVRGYVLWGNFLATDVRVTTYSLLKSFPAISLLVRRVGSTLFQRYFTLGTRPRYIGIWHSHGNFHHTYAYIHYVLRWYALHTRAFCTLCTSFDASTHHI